MFAFKFRTFFLISIHSVLSLCGSLFILLACYILACFFVSFVVSSLFRFLSPLSQPYTASDHILYCANDNDNTDNDDNDDDNALWQGTRVEGDRKGKGTWYPGVISCDRSVRQSVSLSVSQSVHQSVYQSISQ